MAEPATGKGGAAGKVNAATLATKVAGLADAIATSSGSFAEHVAQAAATLAMLAALVSTLPEGAERAEGQRVLDDLAATLRERLGGTAATTLEAAGRAYEAALAAEEAARQALATEQAKGYKVGVGGGIDSQTLNKPHEEALARLKSGLAAATEARQKAAVGLAQAVSLNLAVQTLGKSPAEAARLINEAWHDAEQKVVHWAKAAGQPDGPTGAKAAKQHAHLQSLIAQAEAILVVAMPTDPQAINLRLDEIFDTLNGTYPDGHGQRPAPERSDGTGQQHAGNDKATNFRSGGLRQLLHSLPQDSPAAQAVREAIQHLEAERVQLLLSGGGAEMLDHYLLIKNAEIAYYKSQAPWEELKWMFPGGTPAEQIAAITAQFRAVQLPQVINEMAGHLNDPQWLMRQLGKLTREDIDRGRQALDTYFATPIVERGIVYQWRRLHVLSILRQVGGEQELSEAFNLAGGLTIEQLLEQAKTNAAAQRAVDLLTAKGFVTGGAYAIPPNVLYSPETTGDVMGRQHWFDQIVNVRSALEFVITVMLPALAAGKAVSFIAVAKNAPLWARVGTAAVRVTSEAILFTLLSDLAKSGGNPFALAKDLQHVGQDTVANLTVIVLLKGMGAATQAIEEALAKEVGKDTARSILSKPLSELTKQDALTLTKQLTAAGLKTGGGAGLEAGTLTIAGAGHGGAVDWDTFLSNLTLVMLGKGLGVVPELVSPFERPRAAKEPLKPRESSKEGPAVVAATGSAPTAGGATAPTTQAQADALYRDVAYFLESRARDAAVKIAGAVGSAWVRTNGVLDLKADGTPVSGMAGWNGVMSLDWARVCQPLVELLDAHAQGRQPDPALLARVKQAMSTVLHEHGHHLTGVGSTYAESASAYAHEGARVLEEGVTEAFAQDNVNAFMRELGFGPYLKDLEAAPLAGAYEREVTAVRWFAQEVAGLTGVGGPALIRILAGLTVTQKFSALTKRILETSGLWDRMTAAQRIYAQRELGRAVHDQLQLVEKAQAPNKGIHAADALKAKLEEIRTKVDQATAQPKAGSLLVAPVPPTAVAAQPAVPKDARTVIATRLFEKLVAVAGEIIELNRLIATGNADASTATRLERALRSEANLGLIIDELSGQAQPAALADGPLSKPAEPSAPKATDLWLYDSDDGSWIHWGVTGWPISTPTPAATPTPTPDSTPTTPAIAPAVAPAVVIANTSSFFSRIAANVGSPLGAAIVLGLAGLGAIGGATVLGGSGPTNGGPTSSNPAVGGATTPALGTSVPVVPTAGPTPAPTLAPTAPPGNLVAVCPVTAQQAAGLVPGGRVPVMTSTSMNGPGQALVSCGYSFAIDGTGVNVGQGSRIKFVEVSIAGPPGATTIFLQWSQGLAQVGADGSSAFNDIQHGGVGILQGGVGVSASANATCTVLQHNACNTQINGILEGFLQASLAGNPIRTEAGPSGGPAGGPSGSVAPTLEIGPIAATFVQADFATTYSVRVSGNTGSTTYRWSLAAPTADPTCRQFGTVPTDPKSAIWHHGDLDGCNHAVEGPQGHQGTVTVVISDSSGRTCTASFAGTHTGTGNPAMCTTGAGPDASPAAPTGAALTAAPGSIGAVNQPPSTPAVATSSPLLGGILGGLLGGLAGVGLAVVVIPPRKPKPPIPPVGGKKKTPRDCKKELDALNKADSRLKAARAAAQAALAATDAASAAHDAAHHEMQMAQSTLEAVQSGQQVTVSEGPSSAIRTIVREESSKGGFKPATAKNLQNVEMTHRMTINEAQRGLEQATAGVMEAEANLAAAQAAQARADDAEAAAIAAYQAAREAYSNCLAAQ